MLRLEPSNFRHCSENVRAMRCSSLYAVAMVDASVTGFFVDVELEHNRHKLHVASITYAIHSQFIINYLENVTFISSTLCRVGHLPNWSPSTSQHIPEYCPFRLQTKQFQVIIQSFTHSLPASITTLPPATYTFLQADAQSSTQFLYYKCYYRLFGTLIMWLIIII